MYRSTIHIIEAVISRGPGSIQRRVLALLRTEPRRSRDLPGLVFYRHDPGWVAAHQPDLVTDAQRSSIRRALRSLAAQGIAAAERRDGRRVWRLVDQEAARRTERVARRRERREQRLAAEAVAYAARRMVTPCPACGRLPTPEGHDGCLGTLPGVTNACCGHGLEEAYVQFASGLVLRGQFDHVRARKKRRTT